MELCKSCNKRTIIKHVVWLSDRPIMKKRCCNPLCKDFEEAGNFTIKPKH